MNPPAPSNPSKKSHPPSTMSSSPPHTLPSVAAAAVYLSLILHSVAAIRLPLPLPLTVELPPTLAAVANNLIPQTQTQQYRTLKDEFLEEHNEQRSVFNLPPLTWDQNLTRFARRWGDQRAGDCKMVHSKGPYGENLFWGKLDHWTPAKVVRSWADENRFYDLENNQCAVGKKCGHYTQMIWRESLRLGCARVNCDNGQLLVICEYDPPGNFVNERPV